MLCTDIEKNPGPSVYVDATKTILLMLHTVKELLQYLGEMCRNESVRFNLQ